MTDLLKIYQKLLAAYGPRHWWPAQTPFEMAVGAILTQNTNWRNVEKAILNLRHAEALSVPALAALPRTSLEGLIRPSGFFRQKAERLQLFTGYLQQHYEGRLELLLQQPLEPLRTELLSLKGIGPETADSILLYAGEHLTFVVDAYTGRIFERLGILCGQKNYAVIRQMFMDILPPEAPLFNEYHALIVAHAKEHCRKKPACTGCPLADRCRYLLDRQSSLG
ncbi:endonuclease III domain-containing protein [Geopsychrobacter electrodiphilus]|uniref:endonuclease III domain-containing protein n=1 Tax=Geopsychrobacter electrodiphilus TaxID=225196 RepID=UPI00035D7CF7|nr:endonuclease III domain-containing protein [Geopsychrobacter electrodiphilus]